MDQTKVDEILIPQKLSPKDLDFDNLEDDELKMIQDEISVIIKIRELKHERIQFVIEQLKEEKLVLRNKMLKDLKEEKKKVLNDYKEQLEKKKEEQAKMKKITDDEEESYEESVIYDKKTPKGRVLRRPSTRKK